MYCSQPCATFGPYIFTTKLNLGAGRRAVSATFPSRSAAFPPRRPHVGAVGTTIAPERREMLFLEANSRALSLVGTLIILVRRERLCHRTDRVTRLATSAARPAGPAAAGRAAARAAAA